MTTVEATNRREDFTSQLSSDIWGHRFKDGQRGPEYVLEFLNVLFGANYSFDDDVYYRKRSVGLREFIFEGVKEGKGTGNILYVAEEKKEKLVQSVQENNYMVLKQFLRNLEVVLYDTDGKEADRSWFARSLYPLHESLLYVELRKKGQNLSFERNFFARGGELYFLMLAHGTDQNRERRQFIENRFRHLLTRNKIIEKVVEKITSVFAESETSSDRACKLRSTSQDENVPILPANAPQANALLFEAFGDELHSLLLLDLDIHEMFYLLTSLICFQLGRYMHERSLLKSEQLIYFFDCMDGKNRPISQLAASSYEQHESLLKAKFEDELERKAVEVFGTRDNIELQLPQWKDNPDMFFEKMGLGKMRSRKEAIKRILLRCSNAEDVLTKLKSSVREAVASQLKQLQITRVLSRDGGFATYRRGSASNYRYTISDSFLQMLVFTKVKPGEKMEYHDFLEAVYREYGIVIGESQAKSSGQYAKSRLNIRYFQDNEKALREKLRHNGLLMEFSDATAMIQNPYTSCQEEVYYA
jgi:hypothetical protein